MTTPPTPARPPRRTPVVVAAATSVTAVATVVALLPATSASAAAAPVARDDAPAVLAGVSRTVDVLANDSGDDLRVCEVGVAPSAEAKVLARPSEDGSRVALVTNGAARGTATVVYRVCDGAGASDSATLLVRLQQLQPLRVVKHPRLRGRLKVTNPNARVVGFAWGGEDAPRPDGRRGVPGRRSIGVPVRRPRIYWVAYVRDGDGLVSVEGVVRGIKPRRR